LNGSSGLITAAGRHHLQFTDVIIDGALVVPTGTVLRATGNVVINGSITVASGATDTGGGVPSAGASAAPAGPLSGGARLDPVSAAHVRSLPSLGGGAGERTAAHTGSNGGGSFMIAAKGDITVNGGGSINANGQTPSTSGSGDIGGAGGGAGGLLLLVARGAIVVGNGGAVRANAGAGSNAVNSDGGSQGAGGGGGGGGGVIHFVAPTAPSLVGFVEVRGGNAGTSAASTTNIAGGGGGAMGGNGGAGGGHALPGSPFTAASAGGDGHVITTVVPNPETLFVP
jgi:hypothetical protein